MKRLLPLLLLTISTPSLLAAQDISGGITLGFGDHDASGQGLSTSSLDGRVKFGFDNGITFGVSAGYLNLGIDNAPVDLNAHFVGLNIGYRFEGGMSVGAYAEELTAGASGSPIDLSLSAFGVEAGYATDTMDLGFHLGRTSTSPDLGVDIDNIGVTAKYSPMPNMVVGGAFLRAALSSGGTDLDIDMVGVAAAYDVNEQISVFGGYSRTSPDLIPVDFTTVGLGAGYDLSGMTGMGSLVSLELARTEASQGGFSQDIDTVRLGLTFPLGGKGAEAPLNSVADSIFNPRHGAVSAALTSAF
jgi:hypothetical protein